MMMSMRTFASSKNLGRPRKETSHFMMKGKFPFDSKGVLPLPQTTDKELVNEFLEHRGVSHEILFEYLEEKFHKFIGALINGD